MVDLHGFKRPGKDLRMSSEIAIEVIELSKSYEIYQNPQDRLKQFIIPRLQKILGIAPKQYYQAFQALKPLSFRVKKGKTVGIIGRNGSGKSTLLQMICGTLNANSGKVVIGGRIAALLELGSGFNPEFTGRENIYLNASILGLDRLEVDARFDQIVSFAEIGEFIDRPVKTYSSGMAMRLAFAVAINVSPDVLIVDEALAVGDESFQRKCFSRIEELQQTGLSILYVTHSMQSILQICDEAILLDQGDMLFFGEPKKVSAYYYRLMNRYPKNRSEIIHEIQSLSMTANPLEVDAIKQDICPSKNEDTPENYGTQKTFIEHIEANAGVQLSDIAILDQAFNLVKFLQVGQRYILSAKLNLEKGIDNLNFDFLFKAISGVVVAGSMKLTPLSNESNSHIKHHNIHYSFDCNLVPGTYFISIGVNGRWNEDMICLHKLVEIYKLEVVDLDGYPSVGIAFLQPNLTLNAMLT